MYKDYYFLNNHSRIFLSRGYLPEGVTAEERFEQIAQNAEKILKIDGFANKFLSYFKKGFYSLSTPVINNFGNTRGLPVSCFNSHVSDNMDSILDKVSEVGKMSKMGGGTSGYFGELRPRGAKISVGGESSGPVHFMELFDKVADVVSQGCYDDETEILTEFGWVPFKELSKIGLDMVEVAQVNDDETVSFAKIDDYFEYNVSENLIWFKDSKNIDLLVTKNHNMIYKNERKTIVVDEDSGEKRYVRTVKDKFYVKTAEECPLHRDVKYLHSAYLPLGKGLTNWERILIATQADGGLVKNSKNAIKYRFAKQRKADRLKWLLDSEGIEYTYSFYESDQTHNFYVNFGKVVSKTFDWVYLKDKSCQWCEEFLSEVLEWDGSRDSENSGSYCSVIKLNVDKVQEICALAGYKSYFVTDHRENEPTKSTIYKLQFSKGNYFGVEKLEKQEVFYTGKVYCVEVPSHKLIVRRGGRTVVCGNSARRGSFAAYLPVEHPDILEFLQIRDDGNPIQNMSIGVTISDDWMKSMTDGDKDKRKIWSAIIKKRFESGYPYILFSDTVNNNAPQVYKDKGVKIYSSNLCCLASSERVVTNFGYLTAKELYELGEPFTIFDGKKARQASSMKLISENEKLFCVTLENGLKHSITKCHKVMTRKGLVKCEDLKVGDEVKIQVNKGIFGEFDWLNEGNDWFKEGMEVAALLENKKLNYTHSLINSEVWGLSEGEAENFISGVFAGLENSLSFGLIDGEYVFSVKSHNGITLGHLQLILQNLGYLFCLEKLDDGNFVLYKKGKENLASILSTFGLDDVNGIIFVDGGGLSNESEYSKVASIIEWYGLHPVYCAEVNSEEHLWTVNGIITHNSEITLQSDDYNSFVCVLSSLNLLHWDEIVNTDAIETLIYFLDAVNEEFIAKTEGMKFMETARNFAKTQRALGAGVLGWHSYLQSKMIPFESLDAKMLNAQIWKTIRERADKATEELAGLFGEPELLKGYGRRNVTTLAVAPTTSSSFILGQISPSIEPLNSNYFVKKLAKGSFTYKNPFLKELLKQKNKDDEETWKSILVRGGSVQHLDFLTQEEKDVFKTFAEISQKEVVIQAVQRQKYIDQSQSLNLMIPADANPKEVSGLMIDAWKMGLKTLYYQRSSNPNQELARSILTCKSCES